MNQVDFPASRTGEFSSGSSASEAGGSLQAESMKWNSAARAGRNNTDRIGYKPSSVLTAGQVVPSMSGYSATDYSRITPTGVLPSANGVAPDTYRLMNPTQFGTKLTI